MPAPRVAIGALPAKVIPAGTDLVPIQEGGVTKHTSVAGLAAVAGMINGYYQLGEIGDPPAPGVNQLRFFARDNGAGKTQLCVRFNTGAVIVLATEP